MNVICRLFGHKIEHAAYTETGVIAKCDRCGQVLKFGKDEAYTILKNKKRVY